jgi:hypothetical protein
MSTDQGAGTGLPYIAPDEPKQDADLKSRAREVVTSPETASARKAGVGAAVLAAAVWAWRRRRARKADTWGQASGHLHVAGQEAAIAAKMLAAAAAEQAKARGKDAGKQAKVGMRSAVVSARKQAGAQSKIARKQARVQLKSAGKQAKAMTKR